MRLNEIKVIDLAEEAYFDLHSTLKKYKLLENNNDNRLFVEFIDSEKSSLNPLSIGGIYYPLYLHSAPVANFIKGKYISISGKYIKEENQRFVFETASGITKFPADKNLGDGRIDLFNFNNLNDQQHFLSMLTLKFGNWNINVTPVDL